ncbi:MAG TPA: hypothetical protein VNO21_00385 [Polyangiaceae bacterium]|nr:hypothetical protein [Polyangiaceae bacterium]
MTEGLRVLLISLGTVAVFLVAVVGYVLRLKRIHGKALWTKFIEQTGYRYADLVSAPPEATVAAARKRGFNGQLFVRNYHGLWIQTSQELSYDRRTRRQTSRCQWLANLAHPPTTLWQVADRRLGDAAGKSVREAVTRSPRAWHRRYPHSVVSGDPRFDERFMVFGEDPRSVQRVLATPGLKEALLECAAVDLTVTPKDIRFFDPEQGNGLAVIGGAAGGPTRGMTSFEQMELTIPVHERICAIVARAAVASRS